MKIRETYVKREVCGVNVVVPVGESTKYFRGVIELNPVANLIWDSFTEGATEEEVLEKILGRFNVSRDKASSDLKRFIEKLKSINCFED